MAEGQSFQTDGELDITRSDNVLDLELLKLGVESEFLDDSCVLSRRQSRIVLRLRTSDDHLSRGKDQSGGFRISNTHDDSGETLDVMRTSVNWASRH